MALLFTAEEEERGALREQGKSGGLGGGLVLGFFCVPQAAAVAYT